MFVEFWDMNSGGIQKENWPRIYIEADTEDEAKVIFTNRFGHHPENVTCDCCGEDYAIKFDEELEQLTGYHRGCSREGNRYSETPKKSVFSWVGKYQTLEEYVSSADTHFIFAPDIKEEERKS